jgi:hypothetical protein
LVGLSNKNNINNRLEATILSLPVFINTVFAASEDNGGPVCNGVVGEPCLDPNTDTIIP